MIFPCSLSLYEEVPGLEPTGYAFIEWGLLTYDEALRRHFPCLTNPHMYTEWLKPTKLSFQAMSHFFAVQQLAETRREEMSDGDS